MSSVIVPLVGCGGGRGQERSVSGCELTQSANDLSAQLNCGQSLSQVFDKVNIFCLVRFKNF